MTLEMWFDESQCMTSVVSPMTGHTHLFQLDNLMEFVEWLETKECFECDWMSLKAVRHPATGAVVLLAKSAHEDGVFTPFITLNEETWEDSVQDLKDGIMKFIDSVHERILGDVLSTMSLEERNFAMLQRLSFGFESVWPEGNVEPYVITIDTN